MTDRDLVTIDDLDSTEVHAILDLAARIKKNPEAYGGALPRKSLAMLFEKPSLRTRVSFEAGMAQLGGHAIVIAGPEGTLGGRESLPDVARTLSGMVDGIMARTFSQQAIVDLARYATVPVINGLSDHLHPCQALADFFTIRERLGRLKGVKVAYIGDGNNVSHSLMYAAVRLGAHVSVATPRGYEPDAGVLTKAQEMGRAAGSRIEHGQDPQAAVAGADVVYTDTWASMGQESEHDARAALFRPFQVDAALMARAGRGALFMHCLPAHRGEEVTAEVIDSPQSVVFQQAANRLHLQKGLLVHH